ncbi:WhiB family transcriptional regulator [Streptomyces sp. SAS_275]|uniref:WhiB family transcriptional regulator n=1 Tax=Streptomyces sp. SAS_275 TaxID=3412746 RepID=UPI00403C7AA2
MKNPATTKPVRTSAWKDDAACAAPGIDPDVFHAGERDTEDVETARRVCNTCPVRTACLTAAYEEGDGWGIRAGLTPRQRNAHLRKTERNVARAVTEALDDVTVILRHLYQVHAQPTGDGHLVWTDTRHFINVRNKPYTKHQLAWLAIHGQPSVGHVQRTCDREGCVAETCLADRTTRQRATRTAA